VLTIEGVFFDPHFQERGIFLNVTHPIAGDLTLYDLPWQASGLGRKAAGPAPTLGENNDYVFGDILGLSKAEITKLQEETGNLLSFEIPLGLRESKRGVEPLLR